jgi:predicted acylesterase/phospholipase RssA
MKGGITSGIVYPPLFDFLHEAGYRFRNVGGTSAGAIAAAVTAAAQKGGQPGFDKLKEVTDWLGRDRNLLNLFKPNWKTRPLFDSFIAFSEHHLFGLTWLRAFVALLLGDTLVFALGAAAGILLAAGFALMVGADIGARNTGLDLMLVFGALLGAVAACLTHLYLILTRFVPNNLYGICSGRVGHTLASGDEVLTDWLNQKLNDISGKGAAPETPPLTFGELWAFPEGRRRRWEDERDIDLKMVTSNLSQNQPYVLPFEDNLFIFKEEEFRRLFPRPVVEHLTNPLFQPALEGFELPPGYHFLPPAEQLPVIVATRMSLSFPVLLSMVPLYTISRAAFPQEMRLDIEPGATTGPRVTVVLRRKVVEREVRPGEWREVSEDEAYRLVRARKLLARARHLKENVASSRAGETEQVSAKIAELRAEAEQLVSPEELGELDEAVRKQTEACRLRDEARDMIESAVAAARAAVEMSDLVKAALSDREKRQLLNREGRAAALGLSERLSGMRRQAAELSKVSTQACALRVRWEPVPPARPHRLAEAHMQVNWFSDGGICSNFPIQFFDAWLPTRPTFGVNLTSQISKPEGTGPRVLAEVADLSRRIAAVRQRSAYVVQKAAGHPQNEVDLFEDDVYLPRPESVLAPEWIPIDGLGSFLSSVFRTAQNYRDNMQALLPSYRERIVQIRLSDDEGGLNLNMPPAVIEEVMRKGKEAGEVLSREFDFDYHQWVRFRVLMKKMENSLVQMNRVVRENLIYSEIADSTFDSSSYPFSPSDAATWLPQIAQRLSDIGQVIEAFNPDNLFAEQSVPVPEPVLRVTTPI